MSGELFQLRMAKRLIPLGELADLYVSKAEVLRRNTVHIRRADQASPGSANRLWTLFGRRRPKCIGEVSQGQFSKVTFNVCAI
jgi:hypothetical protein